MQVGVKTARLAGRHEASVQQPLASRVLLATVTAGGRTIVDVELDDFVVEEDGTEREVFDVHVADYPLIVVMDDTASPEELAAIREAAARFVGRVGERAIAVGTLTGPSLLASFDDDRAAVLREIRGVEPRPSSSPVRLAVLTDALRAVQDAGAPFSTIVVVSARAVDPAEIGAADPVKVILDSRVPIHVIAHRSAGSAGPETDKDFLRELADLTRGQYTTIYAAPSYTIALDRLADRLSSEMMIQFLVPPGTSAGDVRVGVKVPGARVTGLGVSR